MQVLSLSAYSYTVNRLSFSCSSPFAALTVEITVDRTDPPGFTPGDSTEYRAASGPQVITCTATGGSGSEPTYQWSSDCRDCPFQVSTSGTIFIGVVHSGDTGTHTCTATRGGDSVEASITFNIVGEWSLHTTEYSIISVHLVLEHKEPETNTASSFLYS